MFSIQMLEEHDIIEATDYCRQLSLTVDGQSDTLMTTSIYGGSRINRLGWMYAAEVCPAFVGKTVDQYNRGIGIQYEFIRGNIPQSHIEPGNPNIHPDLIPVQQKVFTR